MRLLRLLPGIVMGAAVLVSQPVAYSNQDKPSGDKVSPEKTIVGQLLNVDKTARLISLRGPDQKETMVNYNDGTEVISPDRTIQGLSGKLGSDIRTSYREVRGIKLATRIELIEKH